MRIHTHQQTAANTVHEILTDLMPNPMAFGDVARRCSCSTRTVRSWLLRRDELAVPRSPARAKVAALVEKHLGAGCRSSLIGAWAALLNDDEEALLVDGEAAAEARAGIDIEKAQLSRDERLQVVAQARLLLEQAYAHLPFKRARHAVDPIQRLRLLEYRLAASETVVEHEVAFHREMIDIFTSTRDLHTTYVAPKKYQDAVLTLPFMVEEFFDLAPDGSPRPVYVASKVEAPAPGSATRQGGTVVGTGADPGGAAVDTMAAFVDGVEITHWNGVPIKRAIQVLAEKQSAGNPPAAFARALNALTVRPLMSSMVPDEAWIDVTFRSGDNSLSTRFSWEPANMPESLVGSDHLGILLGIDAQTDAVGEVRKERYGRKNAMWSTGEEASGALKEPIGLRTSHLETHTPWLFRAHPTRDGELGYIRIFKFQTRKAIDFANEFARLANLLPDHGLIVDLRGNPGGNIHAAEAVLQVLCKEPIRPCRGQFVTSPMLLKICRRNAQGGRGIPALGPWVKSLSQAVATGSAYSQGYQLTPPDIFARVAGRYPGPVVLIVDALCYSATDMFAAGFIDHRIGSVLGTADNTGAGGANVWRHSDLLRLGGDESGLERLPAGINFRVAVRRTTRVHDHEGEILEDLGIEIDHRHHMSRRDVFEGNRDLIQAATNLLPARPDPPAPAGTAAPDASDSSAPVGSARTRQRRSSRRSSGIS